MVDENNNQPPKDLTAFLGPDGGPALDVHFSPLATPEVVVQPRPDLVAKYRAFEDTLHPAVDTVYHPCGANDTSPSEAFPNSRVIYVEWDQSQGEDSVSAKTVEKLKADGQEAYFADANEFDPGPVDVVILLNPAIKSEGPVSHVKEGGYALVNDYHGNASQLHEMEDFDLVGILHTRTPDHSPVLDTVTPEAYWEEVETNEEFQNSPGYQGIALMTQSETGTATPTLAQYKAALARIKREYPDAMSMDGVLIYGPGLKLFPIVLPHKKGHMDDLFVFRRKSAKQ